MLPRGSRVRLRAQASGRRRRDTKEIRLFQVSNFRIARSHRKKSQRRERRQEKESPTPDAFPRFQQRGRSLCERRLFTGKNRTGKGRRDNGSAETVQEAHGLSPTGKGESSMRKPFRHWGSARNRRGLPPRQPPMSSFSAEQKENDHLMRRPRSGNPQFLRCIHSKTEFEKSDSAHRTVCRSLRGECSMKR